MKLLNRFTAQLGDYSEKLVGDRYIELVLLMTLILSLLFMDHSRPLMGILYIFVPVALLFTKVAKSPIYWTVFGVLILIGFLPLLRTADNHIYLTVYWILAVALCLWTRNQGHSLALNAQLLIGLCFAFATLWKLLSPEFMDGTFFYFTFLTDGRFFDFAELTAGVMQDSRFHNIEVYESLKSSMNRIDSKTLLSSKYLSNISVFMAYWTVFIEGWIALAFLVPNRFKLSKSRDIPLLIFMVTTYPIATVRGFATLLAVLGFAQSQNQNRYMRLVYIIIFIAVPLFSLPYERILINILNLF